MRKLHRLETSWLFRLCTVKILETFHNVCALVFLRCVTKKTPMQVANIAILMESIHIPEKRFVSMKRTNDLWNFKIRGTGEVYWPLSTETCCRGRKDREKGLECCIRFHASVFRSNLLFQNIPRGWAGMTKICRMDMCTDYRTIWKITQVMCWWLYYQKLWREKH